MPRLVVGLPCLNEAEALPGLLDRLAAAGASLPDWECASLVIDDGSTDGTLGTAHDSAQHNGLSLEAVQHPQNLGLGAALLSAVTWFLHNCGPADKLAVMDADGTHPPELLPEMLAASQHADVVIASRYAPGGKEYGLSLRRRIYSRGASTLMSLAARLPHVRDYSCGYRLYAYPALRRAFERYAENLVTEHSFVCMAELLCKLGATGATIAEVPLELHYELKRGASKMNVPVTIRRYVALLGRLAFSREFKRG